MSVREIVQLVISDKVRSLAATVLIAIVISGCTPVTKVARQAHEISDSRVSTVASEVINIPGFNRSNIYFDFDKYDIKNDQLAVLENAASRLNIDSDLVVELSGHADERGSDTYNFNLGLKRAQGVALNLIQRGVSPSRIAILSYGEALPAKSGDGEDAWSENRRVQIDTYPSTAALDRADLFESKRLTREKVVELEAITKADLASKIAASKRIEPKLPHSSIDLDSPDESGPVVKEGDGEQVSGGKIGRSKPWSKVCNDPAECENKGFGVATGTAFFITNDGYLLTNQHVVADSKALFVVIDNTEVPVDIVDASEKDDIALLKANVVSRLIPIGTSPPRKGAQVAVLGYPNISVQGNEQKATFGHINALSGIQGNPNWLQFDAPIQPGNSGSPVLSVFGEVIGIATASLKQDVAIATTGTLAQGVNYAVKIERALPFYELAPGYRLGTLNPTPEYSPVQLVEVFEPSVVMVINYHDKSSAVQAERKISKPNTQSQMPAKPTDIIGGSSVHSGSGSGSTDAVNADKETEESLTPNLESNDTSNTSVPPNRSKRNQFIYQSKPEQ